MLNKFLRLVLSVGLLTRVAWRTDWALVRAGFVDLRWEFWMAAVGLLVLGAGKNAIRFSPPLVLTREQADTAVRIMDEVEQADAERFRAFMTAYQLA